MYMHMCNCAYITSTCKCTCIYNNEEKVHSCVHVCIVIYSKSH